MSKFSDVLKNIFETSTINKKELCRNLQIDRSLLYKYIAGQSLPNENFPKKIIHELCLPPSLSRKIIEAYEISKNGEEKYKQRKLVESILINIQNSVLADSNSTRFEPEPPIYIHESQNVEAINGTININAKISYMINYAVFCEEPSNIYIVMDQGNSFVLELLNTIPINKRNKIQVFHALSFENSQMSNNANSTINNLGILLSISSLLFSDLNNSQNFYNPLYFYAIDSIHNSTLDLFPYTIITGNFAISISKTLSSAIFYSDKDAIQLMTSEFLRQKKEMFPLIKKLNNVMEFVDVLYKIESSGFYENAIIKKDPKMVFYVPPHLYDIKLRDSLPNRDAIKEAMKHRAKILQETLMDGAVHHEFISRSGLDYLIEHRCPSDISKDFVYLLTDEELVEVLVNYKNSLIKYPNFKVFICEDKFQIDNNNLTVLHYKGKCLLLGCCDSHIPFCKLVIFEEKSIVNAFEDYLINVLPKDPNIVSDRQQILNFIQNKIDEIQHLH